jgi:hypothetical protein
MFHLFSKTYIDIDAVIDNNENRIVISETCGFPMMEMLQPLYAGSNQSYGETFEDVVGEGKQFATFLDMMQFCYSLNQEGKKVVIYCDQTAYMKIISHYFKTIFVNIDAESAYRISKANFSKEIMVTHRSIVGMSGHYENWLPSLEVFTPLFNEVSVDDTQATIFLTNIGMQRSVEYLLASYIYNGSFKEELKNRIYLMINRHVEEVFDEVWRSIQINILKQSTQDKFNTGNYNIDNITDVLNDPIFATIKSINAWRAARGGSNPGRTPLDLSTFTDEEIALIIKQAKIAVLGSDTLEYPTIERKIFYIGILRNTELSDQELEDILDFELNPPDDQRFWPLKDEETINIFLADYVLEARKYERTSTLAPYLLK